MNDVLELQDAVVQRNGREILNVEHLAVRPGEVLTIIGPNGAGKSTLLLVLARLLLPDEGRLLFEGRTLGRGDGLAYRRKIGLVLQAPMLLNASVYDNVVTGLRFHGISKAEQSQRAGLWLEQLHIGHLSEQRAGSLSGGEAQRVSLARAFALDPEIVFLDEPFSGLDTPTRTRLLEEFQLLLANTGKTTVFVTHDMNEALFLGDRVAVILNGKIHQIGAPDKVFAAPASPEVAAFLGVDTTVAGVVITVENGHVVVAVNDQHVEALADVRPGRPVMVCLRPEDITLWDGEDLPASSARNRFSGPITKIVPRGPLVYVEVDCGFAVSAAITRASAREMALEKGKRVTVTFKASAVHLIPRQEAEALPGDPA
jgi:tungstate transport system ATP-binding protein